jgi:ribosomal protein S19
MVTNCDWSKPSTSFNLGGYQPHNLIAHTLPFLVRTANEGRVEGRPLENSNSNSSSQRAASWPRPQAYRYDILDPHYQVGNCIPSADIRIGTWVHNIECNPGQGAKPTRAAGTFAKTMKKPGNAPQCLVRLPPGVEKLIDPRCRATIGIVPNPNHGARKRSLAGQSRWLGRRPIVRGVAMNPVDHPHGGGEGRTKGGRPSVSPWGKPTKAGFRTVVGRRRNQFAPRRSIWKGSFVDAFSSKMRSKRENLSSRKIRSRRSPILPESVDCFVQIYNGKTPARCKITEGKVGHKSGESASARKRKPPRTYIGPGRKGKR